VLNHHTTATPLCDVMHSVLGDDPSFAPHYCSV
jgi:hypothetical protein